MFRNNDILSGPDELWSEVSNTLENIFDNRNMSKERYVRIYSYIYDYCAAPSTTRTQCFPEDDQGKCKGLIGFGLYKRIVNFYTNYLEEIERVTHDLVDEEILTFYHKEWKNYQFKSKVINSICSYLNRSWIGRYVAEGRGKVFSIYFMALIHWKNIMFWPLGSKLTNVMLEMIDRERRGEVINTGLLKSVISSYVDVGTNESLPPVEAFTLDLYKNEFERDFLCETELFYQKESDEFLNNNPVLDYIKKVEQRFNEETQRVQLYLHSSTLEPLSKILVDILVLNKIDIYFQEIKNLLVLGKNEDIARLYNLIVRIPNGKSELEKILEHRIYEQGLAAVNKCGESAQDARTYVNTILSEYHKSHELVRDGLNNDNNLMTALEKAFRRLINTNTDPNHRNKSPELLARYCDTLLKKSSKQVEEGELEDAFEEIMIVFKFIDDKDVFQKFYAKFLAKRLVTQTSVSEDAEATMISKLKHACGYEYTCKIQKMFQDIEISKNLRENYKIYLTRSAESKNVDFYVQILSSGSWPFAQTETFSLPPEMEKSLHKFSEFYNTQHNGRKLHWLYSLCKGELQTNCFKYRYTLQVSTYQMAILLQYNESTSWTLQRLHDATNIKMDYIIQVIQIFLKVKLLTSKDEESKLQPSSVAELFTGYKNKKLKINLNVPMKSEVKAEIERTHRNVEEDRKILIQATIVRIMKMRKSYKHQQLVGEVMNQLNSRFKPRVMIIKKCIDTLISKEYIQRDENQPDQYTYLA